MDIREPSENKLKVIWVVFKDENVGKRLRFDKRNLRKHHHVNNTNATPIEKTTVYFEINDKTIRYKRTQFPIVPAYAVTAHKSQGDTLDKVAINFSSVEGQKAYISYGSFYVALTRVKNSENVYLKDFDKKYIMANEEVAKYLSSLLDIKL